MRKRTAQFIEEQKAVNSPEGRAKRGRGKDKEPRTVSPASLANLEKGKDTQFKPGESGNPGGLPGTSVSQRIARAALANNELEIIEGLGTKLRAGDGYVFGVVADRADGKVKDRQEITGAEGGPVEFIVRLVKGSK